MSSLLFRSQIQTLICISYFLLFTFKSWVFLFRFALFLMQKMLQLL